MSDNHTPEQRSRNMAAIKSRNTRPEIIVRSIVHRLGFRFRLHSSNLPGKPDLVLSRHKKIILVNGCFWHMHDCKRGKVTPATNPAYWKQKRLRNVERDRMNQFSYRKNGWATLIIWECEVKDIVQLTKRLTNFLVGDTAGSAVV